MITKKPNICISISSQPGHLGNFFHNTLYKKLNLKFIYKPIKIETAKQLSNIVKAIKILDIKGCSVSMPHKSKIINFLDDLSVHANRIGAVNTVVNYNGFLKGFNTDFDSVLKIIKDLNLKKEDKILIIGTGGMAKVFFYVLNLLKIFNFDICYRKNKKINFKHGKIYPLKKLNKLICRYDYIINCTPVGMKGKSEKLFDYKKIKPKSFIIDCISNPVFTNLTNYCAKNKIEFIPGYKFSYLQSLKQFKLYTNYKKKIEFSKKYYDYCLRSFS